MILGNRVAGRIALSAPTASGGSDWIDDTIRQRPAPGQTRCGRGQCDPPGHLLAAHTNGARLAGQGTASNLICMKPIVSTRRQFLKRATGLAASTAVLPSIVQGSAPGMAGEVIWHGRRGYAEPHLRGLGLHLGRDSGPCLNPYAGQ